LVGVVALRQAQQLLPLGAPDRSSLYTRHRYLLARLKGSPYVCSARLSAERHLYGSIRASFGASTSATVVVPRSPRLRLVVLLLRMCCLNAFPRRNFPFFVRLKRLAAPRCVFSLIFFGIGVSRSRAKTAKPQRNIFACCGPFSRYVVDAACFAAGLAL